MTVVNGTFVLPQTKPKTQNEILLNSDGQESAVKDESFTVFGHVHMAKTAGSEINTMLASRYERLCGDKAGSAWIGQQVKKHGENHGKLELFPFAELGVDDCDYISLETDHESTWVSMPGRVDAMVELHIPCRNMIEHVLSQCNFQYKTFTYHKNITKLQDQVDDCVFHMARFPTKDHPNITRKCFNPIPVEPFVNYMDQFLQKRRKHVPYYHPVLNKPRDKASECLETDKEAQAHVREHLVATYPYYQYCEECIGSNEDLLAAGNN